MSRVSLRKVNKSDFYVFYKLLSDPKVMEFSEGILDWLGTESWFNKVRQQSENPSVFGINAVTLNATGEVIGYCSLLISQHTSEPEIGYRFCPEFWNHGLATEATGQLINLAFESGVKRITAQIDPNNDRSLGVAKKLGMTFSHNIKPTNYDYADEIWILDL